MVILHCVTSAFVHHWVKWLLCVLFIIAGIRQTAAESISVIASGKNREGAGQNAIKEAVRRVAAANIDDSIYTLKKGSIDSLLAKDALQYVVGHTADSVWTVFDRVYVKMTVTVPIVKIEDALSQQRIVAGYLVKPRIVVALDEQQGEDASIEKTVSFTVEKVLAEKGFVVIESKSLLSRSDGTYHSDSGVARQAFLSEADFVVKGTVYASEPERVDVYGAQFYNTSVQLNARIVSAATGRISAVCTKSLVKKGRSASATVNFALAEGGTLLANGLLEELNAFRADPSFSENRVALSIHGSTTASVAAIEKRLQAISAVRSAEVAHMAGNHTTILVNLRGSLHDVRNALISMPDLKCNIDSLTQSRLFVTITTGSSLSVAKPSVNNGRVVHVKKFSVLPVFPSLVKHYELRPLAFLELSTVSSSVGPVKIGVSLPGVMATPSIKNVEGFIGPGTKRTEIALLLNPEQLFQMRTPRRVDACAEIEYRPGVDGNRFTVTTPVTIYDYNALDWRTPEAVASFVTNCDPVILEIGSQAVKTLEGEAATEKQFLQGMALFLAMNRLGITYAKDPLTSHNRGIDRVQYPAETIGRKCGDCDDLSVLYAALLSSIGIETAIVVYPEHVSVMYNSGIYRKNSYVLGCTEDDVVHYKGTLWIPVETTLLSGGFTHAWKRAAADYRAATNDNEDIRIVNLQEAWCTFPSSPFPTQQINAQVIGVEKGVATERAAIHARVDKKIESQIATCVSNAAAASDDSLKSALYNKAGVASVQKGDYRRAEGLFAKAMRFSSNYRAVNNLAATKLLCGEQEAAKVLFDSLFQQKKEVKVALNRALCYFAEATTKKKTSAFVYAMKAAAALLGKDESLDAYLGLHLDSKVSEKGAMVLPDNNSVVNMSRLRSLLITQVLRNSSKMVAGTTSEASTGNKLSGTTTETSTGALVGDEDLIIAADGGLKGADAGTLAKLRDVLLWCE